MKINTSLSLAEDEWREMCDLSYGLCISCGSERECTEPDAEGYDCPGCGENSVVGAEQLLFVAPDIIQFGD